MALSFPPGSSVFAPATMGQGTLLQDGSAVLDGERLTPSEVQRLWKKGDLLVAPRRRRGRPTNTTSRTTRSAGDAAVVDERTEAYVRWLELAAQCRAEMARPNSAVLGSGDGQFPHRADCDADKLEQGTMECRGCWADHMRWTGRLTALAAAVTGLDDYLVASINEVLRTQSWNLHGQHFTIEVWSAPGEKTADWGTIKQLHSLLGTRIASARGRVRPIVDFSRGSMPTPELTAHWRAEALRVDHIECLLDGLADTAERAEQRLLDTFAIGPEQVRRAGGVETAGQFLAMATRRRLIRLVEA